MTIDLYGFGPALAAGALMTVKLALAALCLGLVLGLLGALAKTSPYKPLKWLGGAYSTLVRGVPELLWVLLIYFGSVNAVRALGELIGMPDLTLSAFAAGVIALGLCFGAYATEVFRGAILAIPKGHREAGMALGLSKPRIFTRLVLPQMWRIALPGLGNLFMILMKDTALVSVIGLEEIMNRLPRPGRAMRHICGNTNRVKIRGLDRPSAMPASRWPLGMARMAPRNTSVA